jgi:hypothetical protein
LVRGRLRCAVNYREIAIGPNAHLLEAMLGQMLFEIIQVGGALGSLIRQHVASPSSQSPKTNTRTMSTTRSTTKWAGDFPARDPRKFRAAIDDLVTRGAEVIVPGCTEFGMLVNPKTDRRRSAPIGARGTLACRRLSDAPPPG